MENAFQKHLRAALNHLYNPDQLRKNPLISTFGLSERFDSPAVLQRILTDAIEAMRPVQGEPLHSDKRRTFEVLQYRYVQQFKQEEVAHHLGVSDRQFRREQDGALELLALSLWDRYSSRIEIPNQSTSSNTPPLNIFKEPSEEWGWLKQARSERIINLSVFISKIIGLMEGVARQNNTTLEWDEQDSLPDLAVHPVAFRQILLNLIQVAVHKAISGKVKIETEYLPPSVKIRVTAIPSSTASPKNYGPQDANLEGIAVHLSELSGGNLIIDPPGETYICRLTLPVVQDIPVLVVDDNAEIIELLQRYTTSTRYNLFGSSDPEQAIDKAIDTSARIIVIDVMMPKIDGWELLGRLRSHPNTSTIPVIVLSILAQEDLAYSLGAKGLLLKPITQEAFLTALDAVFENLDLESRLRS